MRLHWSAIYGILGVLAILGQAIVRLVPRASTVLSSELSSFQWIFLVGFCAVMAYSEGYKGFQKAFSPRVAARAFVAKDRGILAQALSPFFCMALFDATKKRLIVSWLLVTMIVCLVLSVQLLPHPWRGIIDAGVVVGLAYGFMATAFMFVKTWRTGVSVDPELKKQRPEKTTTSS